MLVGVWGGWWCCRVLHTLGADPLLVAVVVSAMRCPHGAFGWGGLVEVDDRAVFARCSPRSRNAPVRFYETSPPVSRVVGGHPLLIVLVVSAMRAHTSLEQKSGTRHTNGCVAGACV